MGGLRRHRRFYLAFVLGLALFGISFGVARMAPSLSALLAFDAFAALYLTLTLIHAARLTPEGLRAHVGDEDEGIALIVLLAAGSVLVSLAAVLAVLGHGASWGLVQALALAAVPLGWAMVHMVAAFRYAHLYHGASGEKPLVFAGHAAPGPVDFLYFAFVIGMTAQVSDVVVRAPRLRRAVLIHSVAAFFYNTVILALAVTAAAGWMR